MKNIFMPFFTVYLAICLAACAGSRPTSSSDQVSMVTDTPTATALSTPAASPTAHPRHEYLVYGVKSVVYAMSDYDASQQKIPLSQYIHEYTDIFSYAVDDQTRKIIFSDKNLPVFIMNSSGGGETAIHDIVAASPSTGRIYARMLPRDQYITYQDAGGLYELSTDGTN